MIPEPNSSVMPRYAAASSRRNPATCACASPIPQGGRFDRHWTGGADLPAMSFLGRAEQIRASDAAPGPAEIFLRPIRAGIVEAGDACSAHKIPQAR